MKREVIPTVFSRSIKEFKVRFHKIIALARSIHIDIMDGKFVEAKSISLASMPSLKRHHKKFEAHLMVKNPEKYFSLLKRKGFYKVIFHYEAIRSPNYFHFSIANASSLGLKVFLAINPSTSLNKILQYKDNVNGIMVMGIRPGKEHMRLMTVAISKIRKLRNLDKKIPIQVDGGVNTSTAAVLRKAGVNIINSGSFVNEAENPASALKELRRAFQ